MLYSWTKETGFASLYRRVSVHKQCSICKFPGAGGSYGGHLLHTLPTATLAPIRNTHTRTHTNLICGQRKNPQPLKRALSLNILLFLEKGTMQSKKPPSFRGRKN